MRAPLNSWTYMGDTMLMNGLRWLADNPWVAMARGVILIIGSLLEAFETGFEDAIGMKIGLIHTVLVMGVVEVLRAFPDIVEGAESIAEHVGQPTDKDAT